MTRKRVQYLTRIYIKYFKFIYYLLQTKGLPRLAIVTGVPGINRTTLANVNVQLSPINIQKQIVAKLSAAQEYKKRLVEQKVKLKELFDSVLHKSMTPKLKVAWFYKLCYDSYVWQKQLLEYRYFLSQPRPKKSRSW